MATARVAVGPSPARAFGVQVAAPTQPAAEVLTATADTPKGGQWFWALVATVVIVGGAFVLDGVTEDPAFETAVAAEGEGETPAPVEGLTIFAVFFVAAQGLERLLEPFSKVLLPAEPTKDEEKAKTGKAQTAAQELAANKTADTETAAQAAVNELAAAKAQTEANHQQRVIIFWGLATLLAMVVSATFRLYFLRTVGIADASRAMEILATGLIIGAGTKPLHDLVTMIQAKAETAESQSESSS